MPVTDITYQPIQAQLLAAYRPIRFIVTASGMFGEAIPPFVACDIYIETVYYKSMIRTAPESSTVSDSNWQFDISDALQEYMQADLAVIDNDNILLAPHMSAKVYCRFRASGIDANGFTVEEETIPIQGTRFTDPIAGTGLLSNTFFAINATLQHEDNQNLASHLNAFKQGGWNEDAYPLSHRRKYFFCPGDSDHYPVIFKGECLEADLKIHYRYKGELATQTSTAIDVNTCDPIGFSVEVTANRVDLTLDEEVPAGQSVLVRYRKQATIGAEWIEAGSFTSQNIFFFLHPGGQPYIFAGDYDVQVIHFCSSCISATPEDGEFTMSGEVVNNAWRGISPFCVYQTFPGPVYVVLELRDEVTEENYFPTSLIRNSKKTTTTANLYAKFFSDANHLTPVTVTQDELKVVVKKKESASQQATGGQEFNKVIETLQIFNEDAAGTEILLGNVKTFERIDQYGPYPTITSTSISSFTFSMFPNHVLQEGNTGYQGYATLQEYNIETLVATGVTKDNIDSDPDYIAPVFDIVACVAGPDNTKVTYGAKLQVAKVEFRQNPSVFFYGDTVTDTEAGGYQYLVSLPSQTTTHISVKAKTLDSSNTTGNVVVRVTSLLNGVQTTQTFTIKDNIEKQLPGIFRNVSEVNISNL
jgi:hypothetical protein